MLDSMFATETMAELSARQGRLADAMAIYRHLIAAEANNPPGQTDLARLETWRARLAVLELGPQGAPPIAATPPPPPPAPVRADDASARRPSLVIRETVRSGQVIYADGRDLIVVASVNSGAQVLADGNIHVYGALMGRAVAGAHGQRDVEVFCLALQAELVGVDIGYLVSEDISSAHWGGAARIALAPDGRTCTVAALPVGKSLGQPAACGLWSRSRDLRDR